MQSAWAVAARRSSSSSACGNSRRCASSVFKALRAAPARSSFVARASRATSRASASSGTARAREAALIDLAERADLEIEGAPLAGCCAECAAASSCRVGDVDGTRGALAVGRGALAVGCGALAVGCGAPALGCGAPALGPNAQKAAAPSNAAPTAAPATIGQLAVAESFATLSATGSASGPSRSRNAASMRSRSPAFARSADRLCSINVRAFGLSASMPVTVLSCALRGVRAQLRRRGAPHAVASKRC